MREGGDFAVRHLGVFLRDNFTGSFNGFIEHVAQRHVITGTRFHQFPIRAQNAAVRDMPVIGVTPFASRDLENLAEMQLLRRAGHDPDGVAVQIIEPVIHRRDIAGGVVKSAIAFAHDARRVG